MNMKNDRIDKKKTKGELRLFGRWKEVKFVRSRWRNYDLEGIE